MNGLALILWLRRRQVMDDFNPITDHALADIDPAPEQVAEAFQRHPWCRRVFVNRKPFTRKEWKQAAEVKEPKDEVT